MYTFKSFFKENGLRADVSVGPTVYRNLTLLLTIYVLFMGLMVAACTVFVPFVVEHFLPRMASGFMIAFTGVDPDFTLSLPWWGRLLLVLSCSSYFIARMVWSVWAAIKLSYFRFKNLRVPLPYVWTGTYWSISLSVAALQMMTTLAVILSVQFGVAHDVVVWVIRGGMSLVDSLGQGVVVGTFIVLNIAIVCMSAALYFAFWKEGAEQDAVPAKSFHFKGITTILAFVLAVGLVLFNVVHVINMVKGAMAL